MMTMTFNEDIVNKYGPFSVRCDLKPINTGKLSDYTLSLKDSLWLKGVDTTACSDILQGFKPIKDSTVASKVLRDGGRIVGKTKQDEFGFGTFCTNLGTSYSPPLNPYDKERCTGGSSGGSASAVALLENHLSVAESTGGSITTPASFCGVVGVCPTYGLVSRNGLIPYASSLDKVGTISRDVYGSSLLLSCIAGNDNLDETSCSDDDMGDGSDYTSKKDTRLSDLSSMKIAFVDFDGIDIRISQRMGEVVSYLSGKGLSVDKIDIPYIKEHSLSSYYVIAMAEASTHLASLSGIRYGRGASTDSDYDDYFSEVRTQGFTDEAKRRIILGTYVRMAGYRGKYYEKALKVRKRIIDEYKKIFQEYDAIICPSVPCVAPRFDEIKEMSLNKIYSLDRITAGPNLAGVPNMTLPINKKDELPYGMMLITDHFREDKMFSIAFALESGLGDL